MGYLIKAVGVDLASVSSGLSALTLRAGTWETSVVDARIIHLNRGVVGRMNKFSQHLAAANKVLDFVKKHKPDLVGMEDYTNQVMSYVAFSMGEVGGITRLLLWQAGYRQLLITPSRVPKIVLGKAESTRTTHEQNKPSWKVFCEEWVKKHLKAEFAGTPKERSDMADASIYALIAACFFSYYWLREEPPLTPRQREAFYNKVPSMMSKQRQKGWTPSGLMDIPHNFLVRNPAQEVQTYTPEWMKTSPADPIYIS